MSKAAALLFILLCLFGFINPAFAQSPKKYLDSEIPEEDGTFELTKHPDMKVRVIVHKAKPTTSELLSCSVSDPDSNSVTNPAGWHLADGSWHYLLNTSSTPLNLSSIATNAFNSWSATNVGKHVTFVSDGTTNISQKGFDNKNIIAWGRTQRTALSFTYTWYYTANNQVAEEDTIFNKKFSWNWTPYSASACVSSNSYDAQNILTHELGHWMGLDDEYAGSYVNNTMYGYGAKAEIKKDTLTTGDINGIQAIYP